MNTCTCDCPSSFTGWICAGNILVYFINGNIWCQPRNWQWGVVKNESYEKRDDFNFPFICRTIPVASAYEVYISQLIQYSRACRSYQYFLDRWLLLTREILSQGFLLVKLKSSLRKYYGRHHDLGKRYEHPCHKWQSFPHSWLIIGFVIRLTRHVPLVEQEMFTFPEHLSSSSV